MNKLDFNHRQSAHCENGVAANIFEYNGVHINEPLVFGIGAGLFYIYIPFLRVNEAPAISYRPMPGWIFSRAAKRLGIKVERKHFRNIEKSFEALDENLDKGIATGLQVGVYQLPYFPVEYRFHFNAHNLVVYGKKGNEYLISDPVMEFTTTLTKRELTRVRFTKGIFSPRGHMYYPIRIPETINFEKAIVSGIKRTTMDMLAPVPYIGSNGIKYVGKKILVWKEKDGVKKLNHYLAQIIRMQEEIGTGGGGFRFIYSAFLQQSSDILKKPELNEFSMRMTEIGDEWRDFAVKASRVLRNRDKNLTDYKDISDILIDLSGKEQHFFRDLKKVIK